MTLTADQLTSITARERRSNEFGALAIFLRQETECILHSDSFVQWSRRADAHADAEVIDAGTDNPTFRIRVEWSAWPDARPGVEIRISSTFEAGNLSSCRALVAGMTAAPRRIDDKHPAPQAASRQVEWQAWHRWAYAVAEAITLGDRIDCRTLTN